LKYSVFIEVDDLWITGRHHFYLEREVTYEIVNLCDFLTMPQPFPFFTLDHALLMVPSGRWGL